MSLVNSIPDGEKLRKKASNATKAMLTPMLRPIRSATSRLAGKSAFMNA